ncbi:MAG: hypothetical protein LBU17_03175 [Treponema sp.]|jgi:hypothetical protein|nr:hypothetical protein [Treponema sp.]
MQKTRNIRILDITVLFLCLSGTALAINLFWQDMNRTLTRLSETPVGTLSYKYHIVQRRFGDRLSWNRLQRNSPLYNGDRIHTADFSDATITLVNEDVIDMLENTLIQLVFDQEGAWVELFKGNIGIQAKGDGLNLRSGANRVKLSSGSIAGARVDSQGFHFWLIEGYAALRTAAGVQGMRTGSAVTIQADGSIDTGPHVVVLTPLPYQRIVTPSSAPVEITFSWKTINFPPNEQVHLEIAEDQRFTRLLHTHDAQEGNTSAIVELPPGTFWWRVSAASHTPATANITMGKLAVIVASPPVLVSPSEGKVYIYWVSPDAIRFQWSASPETDQDEIPTYLLEAADNPRMQNPRLRTKVQGFSLLYAGLMAGTWYWRVSPVYPDEYQGTFAVSPSVSFAIQQGVESLPVPVRIPPVVSPPLPKPELETPLGQVVPGSTENLVFRWRPVPEADAYEFSLYAGTPKNTGQPGDSQGADAPHLVYENQNVTQNSLTVPMHSLKDGSYFWTLRAFAAASPGAGRREGLLETGQFVIRNRRSVRLEYPPSGHAFTGLDALRRPGTIQWSSTEPLGKSRFILSRNRNLESAVPVVDLTGPSKSIHLPPLTPGTYYWTIQAETPDGLDISAAQPFSFRVLVPKVAPVTLDFPKQGYSFTGLDALRQSGVIRWSSTEMVGTSRFVLSRNSAPLQGTPILDMTDPGRAITLPELAPGTYYWTIRAKTTDGLDISATAPARFQVLPMPQEPLPISVAPVSPPPPAPVPSVPVSPVSLEFPEAGHRFSGIEAQRQPIAVRWKAAGPIGKFRFILSRNPNLLQGMPVLESTDPSRAIILSKLTSGTYYWTIQAETPEGLDISAARPAYFQVLPVSPVSLEFPEAGHRFSGIEAQRQPGTVRWSSVETVGTSRFILSRNPDLLWGTPILEITDPGRSIILPRLAPGTYYWTIRAETLEGLDISAPGPSSFLVLPIPLLPRPQGMLPVDRYKIDAAQVQKSRDIIFTWDLVPGANAYIFTLLPDTHTLERKPLIHSEPLFKTAYVIEDMAILDVGHFIWQVEALYIAKDGVIEQRGTIGEQRFTIDIPSLVNPKLGVNGIIYGNSD